jgi:hypothetical protein
VEEEEQVVEEVAGRGFAIDACGGRIVAVRDADNSSKKHYASL